ncbi:MAG: CDP-diacylglycerol--glycerol-3-phosphate 3-phosphatidyltransferase [Candidatus Omnitrophica bacterium]|nr:CDP-diacylglycerol--glycerol-3-phosphate 3-phosphatidyltransferase [Candidatus Omnitrophota bacterium]
MNWATRFTVFRIVLVPVFITTILYHRLNLAFLVFLVATCTDALDGYLARVREEQTRLGAILDPIADKMLIGSAFVSFSVVSGLPEYLKMPAYVPIVVISRDVIILLGVALIHIIAGHIEIKPTFIGKLTTVFQMMTVIALLVQFVHASWLWNITVVITVISGLDYIRIGSNYVNGKL